MGKNTENVQNIITETNISNNWGSQDEIGNQKIGLKMPNINTGSRGTKIKASPAGATLNKTKRNKRPKMKETVGPKTHT
jgi:hypothetical protein